MRHSFSSFLFYSVCYCMLFSFLSFVISAVCLFFTRTLYFYFPQILFFFCLMIRRPPRSTRTYPLSPYTPLFQTGPVAKAPSGGPRRCRPDQPFLRQSRAHRWARRQPFAKGIEMRQRAQLAVEHRPAGPQDEDEEVQIAEAELIPKRVGTFPQTLVEQRSEEHTSELQSLMRISYAVFCLKKKTQITSK